MILTFLAGIIQNVLTRFDALQETDITNESVDIYIFISFKNLISYVTVKMRGLL